MNLERASFQDQEDLKTKKMKESRGREEIILALLLLMASACFLLSFTECYWYIYDLFQGITALLFLSFIYGYIKELKSFFKVVFITLLTLNTVNLMSSVIVTTTKIFNRKLPVGEIEEILSQQYEDYILKFSIPFALFIAILLWKPINRTR